MPMQAPQDRYVQVGQICTRFWCLGEEGTTVVLIHGFGVSVESWLSNIHALAEHHRVYALDLVGFGRSDKPPAPYSIPYFAQFVHDFMDTQGIDRASLVGGSLGGGVALQFALQFPDRVEKLILVDSVGLGKEISILFGVATLPLVGELLFHPSRKVIARLWRAIFFDPALITDELIDRQYELSGLPGAKAAKLSFLRNNLTLGGPKSEAWRPIVENLGHITAPTLVVWGQQDRLVPVAHAWAAKERMPNVRLHIFDRCGHGPPLQRSEEFNELVLEFLAGEWLRQPL